MNKDPVRWDTYNPNAPEKPANKPLPNRSDLAHRAKNSPGPALRTCDECGEAANPCWSDDQFCFCRGCVPDELRYPTGNKP